MDATPAIQAHGEELELAACRSSAVGGARPVQHPCNTLGPLARHRSDCYGRRLAPSGSFDALALLTDSGYVALGQGPGPMPVGHGAGGHLGTGLRQAMWGAGAGNCRGVGRVFLVFVPGVGVGERHSRELGAVRR